MFIYAKESKLASLTVKKLLGTNGPFHGEKFLDTKSEAYFFLSLSEAAPDLALNCLEYHFLNKSIDVYYNQPNRRQILSSLKIIIYKRELFKRGMLLLIHFAEAENETWSNNATGEFIEIR